jgi:hypothetical protein
LFWVTVTETLWVTLVDSLKKVPDADAVLKSKRPN